MGFACRQKAVEKGGQVVGQLFDNVATLLHQQGRQTKATDAFADCTKPFPGDGEVGGGLLEHLEAIKKPEQGLLFDDFE